MNRARLHAFLSSRRATWILFVLILLLSLPALSTGWQHDDYIHQRMLHGSPAAQRRSPDELYCFAGGPHARRSPVELPWWYSPTHRSCFFRPLSSVSLALDHTHLLRHPELAHAHSLLWFLLICGALHGLARRLLSPAQANLALLIYGVSGFSVSGVAWLAARHTVVSAAIAGWGLLAYVGGRSDGRPVRTLAGLLLLTLALLAGESSLSAFAFVAAYELFLASDAPRRRLAHLAGATAIAGAYVLWYARAAYGTADLGLYLDPVRQTGPFLLALPGRLLALWCDALLGISSTLWHFAAYKPLYLPWSVLSLGVLLGLLRLSPAVRSPQSQKLLRFFGLGSLAAVLPMASAVLGGRLLIIPGIGLACFFALLVWPGESPDAPPTPSSPRLFRVLLGITCGLLFLANPAMRLMQCSGMRQLSQIEDRISQSFLAPCDTADHYFLLGSDDFAVAMFAPYLLEEPLRRKHWQQITLASSDIAIQVLDEKTLRLRAQPPGLLLGGFVLDLTRPRSQPLQPGQRLPIRLGEVLVEEVSPRGVLSLQLRLSVPYQDGSICWLRFDGETVVPFSITDRNVSKTQIVPYSKSKLPF